MTSTDKGPEQATDLRRQAEDAFREQSAGMPENVAVPSSDEARQTLHELQVHQIELEMQNEELRRAQAELDAARARYFDLYNLAPVGYCTVSDKGLIREANLTAATLLGVARGALVGQPISRIILKEDQDIYYGHHKQLLESREPQTCELRMVKKDRTIFWALVSATVVPDPVTSPGLTGGGALLCRITISDITERKRSEEVLRKSEAKIQASLREKETLLKEIHHRVKNNLQVISSLLDMQSSHVQDETAKEALRDSMARVRTMAMIHAHLYQSQDLARIDFGSFVRELIANIRQSYCRPTFPIEIKVDVGEIHLGVDASIPCGLILNELVANALEHAFPEGKPEAKEGSINITMRSENNQVVLTVQDNGIGIPESIDVKNLRSLGLDLVNILVGQMQGQIVMQVDGGTIWTITFPLKKEREWQHG